MTLDEKLDALRAQMQQDIGARGLAGEMFAACAGDLALACKELAAARSVGLLTGFHIPGAGKPETDGPPGAVFLARCLASLGIPCHILADEECHAAFTACGFPAHRIQAMPDLSHVVAIERPGPAADGRCYTMRGIDVTARTTDAAPLLAGKRTVGIGDGGNEVGMGKLPADLIARNIPNGERIACRLPTDRLLVAGISNWGAWALGIGTCLVAGGAPPIDLAQEERLLSRMVAQGLIDGVTGQPSPSVDGVPFALYIQPLLEMERIAR
ncbi:MAG: DUF4392 domain-containing protein [Gemmataceae bacterium]|nr:DUF4392 domain-containing protein [Gemmataceae bacterium]